MENKMEEELLKEENKKDNIIIIIGIIILLIIIAAVVFYTISKKDTINDKPNDNNNSIVTKSDEEEVKNNIEKKGDTLYIYAEGYADMAPIAFTYDCKTENCDIVTTEKGIILYDENQVQYRELTRYEYDQIYNNESPTGEKLDSNGFEFVTPKIRISSNEIPELKSNINIYEIDNNRYVESYDIFIKYDNYKGEPFKIIEDKVIIMSYIYDYQKYQVTNVCPGTVIDDIKKVGSFYILEYSYHDPQYSIYDEKLDTNIASINFASSYYIKDDILYYVDNGVINVVDKNNKKIEYDSKNITAVSISDNKLLYLDKENNINIRNLETNEEFYNSDIKVPRYSEYVSFRDVRHFIKDDNGYKIAYRDYSVVDNSDWEPFIRKAYSDEIDLDEMITTMKSCRKNINECKESAYYFTGYEIKIDNNGQLVSKNYYMGQ